MWPNHLLHVGQLFKASGNNYFAQIVHIFRQFLYFDFPVKSLLGNFYGQFGNFYGHLATFMDIWQHLWTFGNFLLVTLRRPINVLLELCSLFDLVVSAALKCEAFEPFRCPSDGRCISIQYLCDGAPDCSDGYDEDPKLCTAGKWVTPFPHHHSSLPVHWLL